MSKTFKYGIPIAVAFVIGLTVGAYVGMWQHPYNKCSHVYEDPLDITADPTINELRKIFIDAGLEFFIKKEKHGVVKVHFIVRKEEDATT